jgi:hypothetical protein
MVDVRATLEAAVASGIVAGPVAAAIAEVVRHYANLTLRIAYLLDIAVTVIRVMPM